MSTIVCYVILTDAPMRVFDTKVFNLDEKLVIPRTPDVDYPKWFEEDVLGKIPFEEAFEDPKFDALDSERLAMAFSVDGWLLTPDLSGELPSESFSEVIALVKDVHPKILEDTYVMHTWHDQHKASNAAFAASCQELRDSIDLCGKTLQRLIDLQRIEALLKDLAQK